MKIVRILLVALFLATSAFAQAAFDFPANPTVGQKVTAPGGQQFEWDGSKWAAILLPSDFLPKNDPAYTGLLTGPSADFTGNTTIGGNLNVSGFSTHGIATIATLAVTGNLQIASPAQLLFDGFPMGGTCPPGEYVDALSNIGKLTCATPAGGGAFLPLTGGTLTGALGIGQPATTYPLEITHNQDTDAAIAVYNDSATTNVASSLWLNNGPDWGGISLMGTGFVGPIPARSTYIYNTGPNGLRLVTDAGPIDFVVPGGRVASFQAGAGGGPLVLSTTFSSSLYFGDATHPSGSILAWYGGGNDDVRLSAGTHYDGATWIADAPTSQTVSLETTGINMLLGSGHTVGGVAVNNIIARFQHNPIGLSGLALGGFAAMVNGNGGLPALSIGNGYIGGETWANLDISGAAYFNGQWIADCGAGGGATLLQLLAAGSFTMYGAGSMGCGQAVPWSREASWDLAGSHITHMDNDQYYGVPSVSNGCQLEAGSRDTFGVIYCPASTSVSLSFSRPFRGNAVCVVSHDGPNAIGTWYVNSRNSAYALFHCYVQNGTSTPGTCPNSMRVAYHCAGIGG